eukprot:TRINITY_DN12275_c0_g1_i1.p1 TRINITY_DN12275_c0_g1~~TRINITY_DN12275_c0_g1_i1.p1  ORF type:complete len:227 (+),score=35.62 TRINITY_DN12275_c0_g1_i1:1-681(+)
MHPTLNITIKTSKNTSIHTETIPSSTKTSTYFRTLQSHFKLPNYCQYIINNELYELDTLLHNRQAEMKDFIYTDHDYLTIYLTIDHWDVDEHEDPDDELCVNAVSPACGPSRGGQVVRIFGDQFQLFRKREVYCRFGRTVVTGIVVESDQIECITPPHGSGPVALEVSTDGGNYTQNNVIYTYLGPELLDLEIPLRVPASATSPVRTEACKAETPSLRSSTDDNYG